MEMREWILQAQQYKRKYGLKRMEAVMDFLGNPQENLSIIHVTGTNGKGSTIAFLSALFQRHQLSVGAFVSPHLIDYTDRFLVNGQPMSDVQLHQFAMRVKEAEDSLKDYWGQLSFFEVMTAIAFLYFEECQVDVALIEVGIGGLLDTTNIVTPEVSVITSLGMDHEEMLGNSEEAIMIQKTGIIKENRPVVVGRVSKIGQKVASIVADAYQSELWMQGRDFDLKRTEIGYVYCNQEEKLEIPVIGMEGTYQVDNAAVALSSFLMYMHRKQFPVKIEKVQQALKDARWPARMETIHKNPSIILDGAHNLHAMKRFVEIVRLMEPTSGTQTILFSALKRKAYHEMIDFLHQELPKAKIIVTTFDYPGAIQIEEWAQENTTKDAHAFVTQFLETATEADQLFVTGSLYFLSEIRKKFQEKK